MKNSMKQLLRTPGKTILFFLLIAVCSFFLTVSSALALSSNKRIEAAKQQFTTIATVEQKPVATFTESGVNSCMGAYSNTYAVFDELLSVDILDFEGANYTMDPEERAYYLTCRPSWYRRGFTGRNHFDFVAEITPLEDSIGGEPVKAEVGLVLLSNLTPDQIHFAYDKGLHTGDIITFCQHYAGQPVSLEKGKTYYSGMVRVVCGEHHTQEYVAYQAPFSSQYDTEGNEIMGDLPSFPSVRETESGFVYRDNYNPYIPDYANAIPAVVEKTDDETVGEWVLWAQAQKSYFQHYPILATNSLELLPTFHERQCFISSGRAITKEEFETGAKVCLIPNIWAGNSPSNRDSIGDTIVVPFYCTLYGYSSNVEKEEAASAVFQKRYSLLDANGSTYLPFWIGEYEVVGIYDMVGQYIRDYGETEIMPDMMIIPAKSVEVEDQNIIHYGPMLDTTTSFQIPNGTIATFDKALHEAVPEADQLTISYDDNGYEKVVEDFQATRSFALILLLISLAAILSVVILLLYFFIVRQKKRIAIERSLGMTKRQCVVSLAAGLIVLTIAASVIGTVSAATVWNHTEIFSEQEGNTNEDFDPTFSIWAKKQEYQPKIESEIFVPIMMYVFVFIGVVLVVSLLAIFVAWKHVAEPPIFLLNAK